MGVPECQELEEPSDDSWCSIHDQYRPCLNCRDMAEQRTEDDRKNIGRDL